MVDEASYLRLVARLALEDGGSKARQRGVGLQTHRNKLESQRAITYPAIAPSIISSKEKNQEKADLSSLYPSFDSLDND